MTTEENSAPLPDQTQVLIVGGGPVGLGLACELGWRGVQCLIVEENESTSAVPRTNSISVRTMEFCRRWGIAGDVRDAGIPQDYPHSFMYVTSLSGHHIATIDRSSHGGGATGSPFSPERAQRCNQLWFDPVLQRRAQSFPSVTIRHRARFNAFTQTGDSVVARVSDLKTGTEHTIKASYLVACCGGRSSVRTQMGVEMEGVAVLDYPVDVYFRADALWDRHDKGKASMYYLVGPDGVWANLEMLNGVDFWRLTIHGMMEPNSAGKIDIEQALQRATGFSFPHEVKSVSQWVRRARLANTYGSGRVYMAGDAVHQNPPDGGFGMNTGMGDITDLGWKLEAMLTGWGGDHLLQSYQVERRPVAERAIKGAIARVQRRTYVPGPGIVEDGAAGEASRTAMRESIAAIGSLFNADGMALGYSYAPSPICWPSADAPAADTTLQYKPSSLSGARAPHLWLSENESLLDQFGRGFTLVVVDDALPDLAQLIAAAAEKRVPIRSILVPPGKAAGLYQHRFVLVRPDGHVAWSGDVLHPEPARLIDTIRGASLN